MNTLVLDVAASESGALSVLKQYYYDLQSDTQNRYFFCISTPELGSVGNVTVLRFPWVKKSWLHRLWFEYNIVRKIILENNIGRIISLENLILGNPSCEKWIYLHNVIPFLALRFSLFNDPKMWVYQRLIGRKIKESLQIADKVIVQTEWMRDACIQQINLHPDTVEVQKPVVSSEDTVPCSNRDKVKNRFFYPATPYKYKNHMLVLLALKRLKDRGELGAIQLELTLSGQENRLSQRLLHYSEENQLPVTFLGQLPHVEVMKKYANSALIFPSYIEAYGLPLLEAKLSGTLVLASDCSFSREILDGYDAVSYFDPFDVESCVSCILRMKKKF